MARLLILLLSLLMLTGCMTFSGADADIAEDGYDRVQVVNISPQTYLNAKSKVPLEAVIQPEDLMISPIIDITTLKAETDRETSSVVSSTIEQDRKKTEISEAVKTDPNTDTTLNDLEYGTSSGRLALDATENAFKYITASSAFEGAIATYDYMEGRIYEVITSPKAITDFRLRPGESIAGQPIVSNSGSSWQFSMGTSIENGITVQHLFIKPTTVGLDTSMILLTNERTYYFRIASFENTYMTALRFNYPVALGNGTFTSEDFAQYINGEDEYNAENAFRLDLSKAYYDYEIKRYKGKPAWMPQAVFSDDLKTYIQFPVNVTINDDLPSVYVVKNKTESIVNFRMVSSNMYQLDTVISDNQMILLKSGEKEQVRIVRK